MLGASAPSLKLNLSFIDTDGNVISIGIAVGTPTRVLDLIQAGKSVINSFFLIYISRI